MTTQETNTAPDTDAREDDPDDFWAIGWGGAAIISASAIVAAIMVRRSHRCERDLAIEHRITDALLYDRGLLRNSTPRPVLGSFAAERAVQWFQTAAGDAVPGRRRNGCTGVADETSASADPAAGATAPRDARDPAYRERTLVGDRCGFRAWMFWTGAPPETAKVGDVWAYIEKPQGEIVAKKQFRTRDEAWPYAKAALQRALERAGKFDCY